MDRRRLLQIARRVFKTPTAPYAEHHMSALVKSFCAGRRSLSLKEDACGNLIVRCRRGGAQARGTLFAFGAHMDHPGFEVIERIDRERVRAVYRGGGPRRGLEGARVRIFKRERLTAGVPARVLEVQAAGPVRAVLRLGGSAAANRAVAPGDFSMYDFPPMRVRGDRIYTRACDDAAAVAALLAFMEEVGRRRVGGEWIVFFTRAEETGFEGALAMAGVLPRRARIVALENSSALAGARVGGGPVVRVGDRQSIFDPDLTHFLTRVALDCQRRDGAFRFQRKLMDGGTCETTVFSAAGYRAGGLCLPLGNYHTIGPDGRARPEFISFSDLDALVELLVAVLRRRGDYGPITGEPARRFKKCRPAALKRLKSTSP